MRVRHLLIVCFATACGTGPSEKATTLLPCDFLRAEEGALDRVPECARRTPGGGVTVRREALDRAAFGPEGLADARIDGHWFFVTRSGRTAPAYWFDNGTDPFVDGLARTVRDGKIGFVDRELAEVIPPRWDFASPFEDGLAAVCEGCVSRAVAPDGEHHEIAGGKWGYIDRAGRLVVPLVHSRESLPGREAVVRR